MSVPIFLPIGGGGSLILFAGVLCLLVFYLVRIFSTPFGYSTHRGFREGRVGE